MRQFIAKINNLFVSFILLIFYIFVVGVAVLMYRLLRKSSEDISTYWINIKNRENKDLDSAY